MLIASRGGMISFLCQRLMLSPVKIETALQPLRHQHILKKHCSSIMCFFTGSTVHGAIHYDNKHDDIIKQHIANSFKNLKPDKLQTCIHTFLTRLDKDQFWFSTKTFAVGRREHINHI